MIIMLSAKTETELQLKLFCANRIQNEIEFTVGSVTSLTCSKRRLATDTC